MVAARAGRAMADRYGMDPALVAFLAGLVAFGIWSGRLLYRWSNAQANRQAVYQATHPQPNVRPH